MSWDWFLIQFGNVHLILFGGATAYNSYWDRDSGPVGGLKSPPPMDRWMWFAALLIQMIGLLIALPAGSMFVTFYALSMLLFWLYSSPWTRWKGKPLLSLVAIGTSTGFNSVVMGFIAAGGSVMSLSLTLIIAALGTSFILLSLYPVSQIYQRDEDNKRGDQTFAVQYGYSGVYLFFKISYGVGLLFISAAIFRLHLFPGIIFLVLGTLTGLAVWRIMEQLSAEKDDYNKVMRIKYGTSVAFVSFLIIALLVKHSELPVYLGIS